MRMYYNTFQHLLFSMHNNIKLRLMVHAQLSIYNIPTVLQWCGELDIFQML